MGDDTYFKARYHSTAEEHGLPLGRELVFAGLFLAWLAHKQLLSADFVALVGAPVIEDVQRRKLTGAQLLAHVDGIIDAGMVTADGRAVCERYLSTINGGRYLRDYCRTFGITGKMEKDLYVVEDSWASFDKLAPVIDAAFAEIKAGGWPQ